MGRNELTRCSRKDRERLSLKESGNCPSPVETAALEQAAVAADCPAASDRREKSHLEETDTGQVVQWAVLCRWESPWSWARAPMGREGKKTELLTSGCRGKMNLG